MCPNNSEIAGVFVRRVLCVERVNSFAAECGSQHVSFDECCACVGGDGGEFVIVFGGVHEKRGITPTFGAELGATQGGVAEWWRGASEFFEGCADVWWEEDPRCGGVVVEGEMVCGERECVCRCVSRDGDVDVWNGCGRRRACSKCS